MDGQTVALLEESPPMGKRQRGRPCSERDDVVVKLDRAIAGKAKLIATHEGIPGGVAELISDLLQPLIDRRYAKMVHDLEVEGKP